MKSYRTTQLEHRVISYIKLAGLPAPDREYRFHPKRLWRFDFAWPELMIAVECEGAVWTQGRHVRGGGFTADTEKYNEAAMLGWRVLRYTSATLERCIIDLRRLIEQDNSGLAGTVEGIPMEKAVEK